MQSGTGVLPSHVLSATTDESQWMRQLGMARRRARWMEEASAFRSWMREEIDRVAMAYGRKLQKSRFPDEAHPG